MALWDFKSGVQYLVLYLYTQTKIARRCSTCTYHQWPGYIDNAGVHELVQSTMLKRHKLSRVDRTEVSLFACKNILASPRNSELSSPTQTTSRSIISIRHHPCITVCNRKLRVMNAQTCTLWSRIAQFDTI